MIAGAVELDSNSLPFSSANDNFLLPAELAGVTPLPPAQLSLAGSFDSGTVFFVVVLDLLSNAALGGGVLLPDKSWGSGNTVSSSSSLSPSSTTKGSMVFLGETDIALVLEATDSSTAVLAKGASTVALRCLCLVLVLLDGCGSEEVIFGTGFNPACARIAVSKACTLACTGEEEAGCALLGEFNLGKEEQETAAANSLTLGLAVVGTECNEEVEAWSGICFDLVERANSTPTSAAASSVGVWCL